MNGSTHLMAGLCAGLTISTAMGLDLLPAAGVALLAGAASLLPDIDHPRSRAARKLGPARGAPGWLLGHRGVTHSLLALAALAGVCWLLLPMPAASAVAAGYGSHLLLDALTPRGVPLLWPLGTRLRTPLTARSGGIVDLLLLWGLGLLGIFLTIQMAAAYL